MRRFANIFILLFVVDAVYSLVDELFISFASQIELLTSVRLLIAGIVMVLCMVIYACLGIDRRLPKRVLLPMTLYISWCGVAMWPLSGIFERGTLPLIAAAGQIAVVAMAILIMRGQLLLPAELFQKEPFSMRNTLGFAVINLLLAPFLLAYFSLAITGSYLEAQTAGFLRISPVGIYMMERSYHLDDKEIRLAGMMHIGREDYYADLAGSMMTDGTIILTEGVTDKDRLLEHAFSYNKLAGALGLSSQETMRINGTLVDLEVLDESVSHEGSKPDVALADIDINRFEQETIDFLNMLGRTLFSDKPLDEALAEYNAWINENMNSEQIAGVMTDILDKRNDAVISAMARTLPHYDTIIVPWGALHMPAIEAAVLEQGFEAGERKERLGLDFRTLPYRRLWQKWSAGGRNLESETTP